MTSALVRRLAKLKLENFSGKLYDGVLTLAHCGTCSNMHQAVQCYTVLFQSQRTCCLRKNTTVPVVPGVGAPVRAGSVCCGHDYADTVKQSATVWEYSHRQQAQAGGGMRSAHD